MAPFLFSQGIDFNKNKLYNNLFIRSRYLSFLNFWRKSLPTGYIEIDLELCKDCQLCMSVCPHQLIESADRLNQKGYYPACFREKNLKKEERKCTGCALCAISCPEIAIEVYRA